MSRPVVIRVGELLTAEEAAERALERDKRQARRQRLHAHAREVLETVRSTHSPEDADVWCDAMRDLLRGEGAVVALGAPTRARAEAEALFVARAEGDAPSAGGEP